MRNMFDPAIIDAMSHALAFRAPAIIRDVSDVTGEIEVFRATEIRGLERDERATEEWIKHGRELRDALWSNCAARPDKALASLPGFRTVLELTEATCRDDGKALRRAARAHKKLVTRAFRTSPQRGAVMRELTERLLALLDRRYEEKLDFATFIRALIAEYDPAARGGPIFEDVDSLDRFLRAASA